MGVLAEEAVRIRADTTGFHSQVESGVMGAVKKIAGAVGAAFAAKKVFDFGKSAVEDAASLEVQQRRVNAVFGDSAGVFTKFGKEAASAFGLSKVAAAEMSANTGQAFRSMGIGQKQAAGMSLALVKAAQDMGSFTGKDPSDVLSKFQKGTLGATRGLKSLGIVISQTDIVQQALATGMIKPITNTLALQNAQIRMKSTSIALTEAIKAHGTNSVEAAKATLQHNNAQVQLEKAMKGTVPTMTSAQKAMAAEQLILKAAGIAAGDYQKHSGDLGHQQEILQAQLANVKLEIGQALLPVVSSLMGVMVRNLPVAIEATRSAFQALGGVMDEHRAQINAVGDAMRTGLSASMDFVSNTVVPAASRAWEEYGPRVRAALSGVVENVRQGFEDIRAVVVAVLDVIRGHWDDIWSVFGPLVRGYLEIVKTYVATYLNVVADVFRLFGDLIHGRWGEAWGELKNIVRDVLDGVVSMIRIGLTALAASAGALALIVAREMWEGFKWIITDGLPQLPGLLTKLINAALHLQIAITLAAAKLIAQAMWDGIKGIGALLEALGGILWGKVRAAINSTADSANTGAAKIATDLWNGIKAAVGGLTGLAGALWTKVSSAISTVAGQAIGAAEEIGRSIAEGVGRGIVTAPWHLAQSALSAGIGALVHVGKLAGGVRSPSWITRDEIGVPLVQGIAVGIEKAVPMVRPAAQKAGSDIIRHIKAGVDSVKEELAASVQGTVRTAMTRGGQAIQTGTRDTQAIFEAWATNVSTKMQGVFAKAQMQIDKFKAAATPTEALLAVMQAQATKAALDLAVTGARQAMDKLVADQARSWNDLLATQNENMARLREGFQSSTDDMVLAEARYNKDSAALGANDPVAKNLIAAQQAFDTAKVQFDQGLIDKAAFVATWTYLEDAKTAAANNADVTQLLNDYNTWTALKQQTAAGQQAIDEATAANTLARQDAQAAADAARTAAQTAIDNAVYAQTVGALTLVAEAERKNQDERAAKWQLHLDDIKQKFSNHMTALVNNSKEWGRQTVKHFSDGMDQAMGDVEKSSAALAALVAKYLKVKSPTEAGPMSDLHLWWRKLGPTLVASLDTSMVKQTLGDAVTPTMNGKRLGIPAATAARSDARQQLLGLNDSELIAKLTDLVDEMRRQQPAPVTVVATGGAQASVYAAKR